MNYLEIIRNVVKNGVPKQATRLDSDGNVVPVENGTIGTFCEIFRHDMAQGFPLTTLRKMPWQSIRVELEGFIKGITDKEWFKSRKCNFWNEWSNPITAKVEFERSEPDGSVPYTRANQKQAQELCDDLGPIYGYQWRQFGEQYGDIPTHEVHECDCVTFKELEGISKGFDQLKSIVDKLKSNPYDRRMVCSAWNPNQMDMMALPPCHVLWNVVVYGNKLNLTWFQRSCDGTHGVPNNIASYGLLLMLLCEESSLEPGELVGILSDCHLYENTIESAKLMISREEKDLPIINIKRKEDGSFSIFDWEWNQVELVGYNPHPAINMGSVTV